MKIPPVLTNKEEVVAPNAGRMQLYLPDGRYFFSVPLSTPLFHLYMDPQSKLFHLSYRNMIIFNQDFYICMTNLRSIGLCGGLELAPYEV